MNDNFPIPVRLDDCHYGYGRTSVFSGLDLTIEGYPTAVLGPNGAGKSTLFGLISGRLVPRRGSIVVGRDRSDSRSGRRAIARTVGVSTMNTRPIRGLRVREQVAYAGWLGGLSQVDARDQAMVALAQVNLTEHADRPSHALSAGQLHRLGVAQALGARPNLLLLDEPYAGLDPEQRASMRALIQSLSREVRLLVSTHQTDDLEATFDTVLVLHDGAAVFNGSMADFELHAESSAPPHLRAQSAYLQLLSDARVTL